MGGGYAGSSSGNMSLFEHAHEEREAMHGMHSAYGDAYGDADAEQVGVEVHPSRALTRGSAPSFASSNGALSSVVLTIPHRAQRPRAALPPIDGSPNRPLRAHAHASRGDSDEDHVGRHVPARGADGRGGDRGGGNSDDGSSSGSVRTLYSSSAEPGAAEQRAGGGGVNAPHAATPANTAAVGARAAAGSASSPSATHPPLHPKQGQGSHGAPHHSDHSARGAPHRGGASTSTAAAGASMGGRAASGLVQRHETDEEYELSRDDGSAYSSSEEEDDSEAETAAAAAAAAAEVKMASASFLPPSVDARVARIIEYQVAAVVAASSPTRGARRGLPPPPGVHNTPKPLSDDDAPADAAPAPGT
ncbi:hypothetical protein EON68_04050, partial [archaeon]